MSRVFTIGEALIDLIPAEKGMALKDVSSFQKAPGGAPANVACAVSRLGGHSAFIGKLGLDPFGDFLVETLKGTGVDISFIKRTDEAKTALAFVSLKEDGNRDFMFYRNPSADMLLNEYEIDEQWFRKGDILHFCSVDLIEAPVKYAHIKAIEYVKQKSGIVSFDPNIRLPLWDDRKKCRETILDFIPLCSILKVSDEEIEFITSIKDRDDAVKSLFMGDVEIVICTKGSKGADLYTKDFKASADGMKVETVDTTGAGDAFIGAFLYMISSGNADIHNLTVEKAAELLKFSNTAAAITTTAKGAISSLPEMDRVKRYL